METPIRIAEPAMELHIDPIPSLDAWLRTSPELHMKRLLCAGFERIYQLGACFRQGERGERHNPEFTMLEWYRADADYLDMLAETKALIAAVAESALGRTGIEYRSQKIELMPSWELITVEEAFGSFAGWNPVERFDAGRFDLDLVNKVEPNLPKNCPVVLMNYPAEAAALARVKKTDPRVAERWELYIGGIEIANAFSELTDPAEQRARFDSCARARREMGKSVFPLDEKFLSDMAGGFPPSGGVALGTDRLVMLFSGAASLDEIMPFREA